MTIMIINDYKTVQENMVNALKTYYCRYREGTQSVPLTTRRHQVDYMNNVQTIKIYFLLVIPVTRDERKNYKKKTLLKYFLEYASVFNEE